jgi:hypothetical protein
MSARGAGIARLERHPAWEAADASGGEGGTRGAFLAEAPRLPLEQASAEPEGAALELLASAGEAPQ